MSKMPCLWRMKGKEDHEHEEEDKKDEQEEEGEEDDDGIEEIENGVSEDFGSKESVVKSPPPNYGFKKTPRLLKRRVRLWNKLSLLT